MIPVPIPSNICKSIETDTETLANKEYRNERRRLEEEVSNNHAL